MIRELRGVRSGGCEIVVENVGSPPALDIVVSLSGETRFVAGGLRTGERVTVGLPDVGEVTVLFRDATGSERRMIKVIVAGEDGPSLMPPTRTGLARRLLIRAGFLAAD